MLTEEQRLGRAQEAARRARRLKGWMAPCRVCPRECGVDRLCGEAGLCHTPDRPAVAGFGPDFDEVAPLVGTGGSGTVRFAGCALRCSYCQDHEISQPADEQMVSQLVETDALAMIFVALQNRGCHNINLVTPSHIVPQIVEALALAYADGLTVPIVYNCGGYESVDTLRQLDGLIDIYLTDFKYGTTQQYSQAPGYVGVCREAVREMHRQVGDLQINRRGVAQRGLMVRHMVLPGGLAGSREVAKFVADEISLDTWCTVTGTYQPAHRAVRLPELSRAPSGWEIEAAREAFWHAGLHRLATPPITRGPVSPLH
ncbi:MAG: radical SAM protein [Armatimonadetes bacterium]|nr:radical SAM protein [Armatimonadota bacterium]